MASERILFMANRSNAEDIYPETTVPTYTREYMLEGDMLFEAHKIVEYLEAQTIRIDPEDRFVGRLKFTGDVRGDLFRRSGSSRYGKLNGSFYKKPFENLATKDHQHANARFVDVVTQGFEGIKNRIRLSYARHAGEPEKQLFLKALDVVIDGLIAWEERCAKACEEAAETAGPERAAELKEMARILRRVPLHPAETFREAIQSVYFCWQFVPDSLGTADRYLLPCYRHSMEKGEMTRDEAKEYLQELFVMINGWTTPVNKWAADKGGESHFCIGGMTEDGGDAYNELSELIMESLMEIPTYRPEISLRWTEKTPRSVLRYVMDCERHDAFKRVALVGDPRRIRAMTDILGISLRDAVTYTMCGCNEPATQGGINEAACNMNGVRCLDRLLYDCRDEVLSAESFDEFYALFAREFKKDVDRYVEICDGFNRYLSTDFDLVSSLFMDGPVENGVTLVGGGARVGFGGVSLIGTGTVIDSLIVIRQFVYDDGLFTMKELMDMLDANWQGYDARRRMIYRTAKYHGNDTELGNEIARRYTTTVYDLFAPKLDVFGYPFLIGDLIGYCTHNSWFGEAMRATPDGRLAGEAISFGAGQTGGRDREGLAALLNSVAQMDPTGIMTGPTVLNVMLDEALIRDDEKFEKTVALVEAYFKAGGPHIQLNYVSKEELLAAREKPEEHENLRVRVSGFSGYFTLLDPKLQADIIERTAKKE